jgi:hypothetical protein
MSSTGGRNTTPLTQSQIDDATDYARQLGFDGPIDYRPLDRGYNTSYSDLHWLMISEQDRTKIEETKIERQDRRQDRRHRCKIEDTQTLTKTR